MQSVTIADRRAIIAASTSRDFRDLLRRDPRAGFECATGRSAPSETRLSVIEEQADIWEFVVPAGTIETQLPEPVDARGVVENQVYDILREEPDIRRRAIQDPQAFLADRMPLIRDTRVNVHDEQPGEVVLVLPYRDSRDELSDDSLDLVAGGGAPPGQGGVAMDGTRGNEEK